VDGTIRAASTFLKQAALQLTTGHKYLEIVHRFVSSRTHTYLETLTQEMEAHIWADYFQLWYGVTAYVVPALAGYLYVDDERMGVEAEKVEFAEDGIPSWAGDLGDWDGNSFGRNVDTTVLPQMDESVWMEEWME
jgi:hypothetical protein